jgi:hypothetical protein
MRARSLRASYKTNPHPSRFVFQLSVFTFTISALLAQVILLEEKRIEKKSK